MDDDYLWDRTGTPDPDVERLERALAPLRYKERPFEHEERPLEAAREDRRDDPREDLREDPSEDLREVAREAAREDLREEPAKVVPLHPRRPRPLRRWVPLAAAALAAAAAFILWRTSPHTPPIASRLPPVPVPTGEALPSPPGDALPSPSAQPAPAPATAAFAVERLEGAPRVGATPIAGKAQLAVGEWLETDASSRARIAVSTIGTVDVAGGSRVRLSATGPAQHRLDLDHGEISARVDAPPRLFVVGTRSATAVDLGCAYTLTVDDLGKGLLRVTSGWVSLEDGGRASFVQAGASCETRPGKGPGIPSFDDAPAELKAALARFDFEDGGPAAVGVVLDRARRRDAISVWHLISRVEGALRQKVVTRLQALSPRPSFVKESDALALDPAALEHWRNAMTWK